MKPSLSKTVFLILIPVLLSGCTRYYMVQKQTPSTPQLTRVVIDSLNKQRKYFLVHTDSVVYGIDNISVDTSRLIISGLLTTVPAEHSLYLHPHRHFIWGKQRIYHKSEAGILNEVHLYTENTVKDSSVNIPIQNIKKIETIAYDKKKSNTVNTISLTLAVAATALCVALFVSLSQWNF
jgi:hypothetical protein